eukprot:588255-Amphidinium_carterae.1
MPDIVGCTMRHQMCAYCSKLTTTKRYPLHIKLSKTEEDNPREGALGSVLRFENSLKTSTFQTAFARQTLGLTPGNMLRYTRLSFQVWGQ